MSTSSLGNALKKMEKGTKQISVLPVIDPGKNQLLGLLRLHDIYNPISK
jgi:CBS domain-containing protein